MPPDKRLGRAMSEGYDQFWAGYLGVETSAWSVPGVSVNGHVGLRGYRGVWFFLRHKRLVVSAPDGWVPHIRKYFPSALPFDNATEEAPLRELFGDHFERRIGPAFQGSLRREDFVPIKAGNVRQPTVDDIQAIATFRAQCVDGEVESGVDKAPLYRAAYFKGCQITALSGYRAWSDVAGDPCVLTHPQYRGRGWGTAVVSMTVELALNDGKVVLYQTLESNTAAVKIAKRVGYEQYARHVAVRLNAEAPENSWRSTSSPP